ncbi:MAG: hypothetical protein AB7K24_27105 [Gemmataceae bacterium]
MKRRFIILAILLTVLLVEGFVLARMTRLNAERQSTPRRVQFGVREKAESYSAAATRWRTAQPRHWRHVMLQR